MHSVCVWLAHLYSLIHLSISLAIWLLFSYIKQSVLRLPSLYPIGYIRIKIQEEKNVLVFSLEFIPSKIISNPPQMTTAQFYESQGQPNTRNQEPQLTTHKLLPLCFWTTSLTSSHTLFKCYTFPMLQRSSLLQEWGVVAGSMLSKLETQLLVADPEMVGDFLQNGKNRSLDTDW